MEFLAPLLSAAPSAGVGGVLLVLVVYLLRLNGSERTAYRTALAEESERMAQDLNAERERSAALRTQLDQERSRRFAAEERAAAMAARLARTEGVQ